MVYYTDGACSGNGSKNACGGYAVIGVENDKVYFMYSDFSTETTNNREEMKAILFTLFKFGKEEEPPVVYTDSAYALNTFNNWMFNWQKNDWKKSDGKEPENLGIVKAYYALWQAGYRIDLKKVAGHSGNFWNEFADKKAKEAVEMAKGKLNEK